MSDIVVRTAENGDLPVIWQLILDSFLAIVDSTHESHRPAMEKAGMDVRNADLKDIAASYLTPAGSHFWVAEHKTLGVIGCVAIKRANADEAELCRMAVSPALRGGGVGALLVTRLVDFARDFGYLRIVLTTINGGAARFYKKSGFVSTRERIVNMPPVTP